MVKATSVKLIKSQTPLYNLKSRIIWFLYIYTHFFHNINMTRVFSQHFFKEMIKSWYTKIIKATRTENPTTSFLKQRSFLQNWKILQDIPILTNFISRQSNKTETFWLSEWKKSSVSSSYISVCFLCYLLHILISKLKEMFHSHTLFFKRGIFWVLWFWVMLTKSSVLSYYSSGSLPVVSYLV